MKRFIVLLTVMALVTPAFAATLTGNYTETTTTVQIASGGTADTSTAAWVMSPVAPGMTASSGPYSGIIVDPGTGTKFYKTGLTMNVWGGTVNVDQSFGDGTIQTYYSSDSANQTTGYNSLGKVTLKNGTMNLNATVWAEKFQGCTTARTATHVSGFAGRTILNINSGGSLRITGTDAVVNNSGNLCMDYGNTTDSYINVSGTGVLSALSKTGDPLTGTLVGGRTLGFFKNSTSGAAMSQLQMVGSNATAEVWSMNMYCGSSTGIGILKFVSDSAGVSAIDLYGVSGGVLLYGGMSKLDFQLGAVPAIGQVYTLVNLVSDTATQDFTRGKLRNMAGVTLNTDSNIFAQFGGEWYTFKLNYGGGTGNDVTLTYIPEPATMALLSLGGLFLARRRRA